MILFSHPFSLERDMLAPLLAALPSAAPDLFPANARVVREPSIGRIIPDLLFARSFATHSLYARTRLTFLHCHALAMAHDEQGASSGRMCSELYVPEETGERALKYLAKRGFIAAEQGAYFTVESASLSQSRIVAVEVKMRRWREALAQATAYLSFADESLVVMDGNQVRLDSEIAEAFHSAGVGLILLYGRVAIQEISARAIPVMSPERVWALTKLAKTRQA